MGRYAKRILVDTNIWVSKTLRDWTLHFNKAIKSSYKKQDIPFLFLWTHEILRETDNSITKNFPNMCTSEHRCHVVEGIKSALGESKLIAAYPMQDDYLQNFTSDPSDYHVAAAAIHEKVNILMTCTKGFKNNDYYDILSPDSLFMQVYYGTLYNNIGVQAVRGQYKYWNEKKNNGSTEHFDLVRQLKNADCEMFSQVVKGILDSKSF